MIKHKIILKDQINEELEKLGGALKEIKDLDAERFILIYEIKENYTKEFFARRAAGKRRSF